MELILFRLCKEGILHVTWCVYGLWYIPHTSADPFITIFNTHVGHWHKHFSGHDILEVLKCVNMFKIDPYEVVGDSKCSNRMYNTIHPDAPIIHQIY